MDTQSYDRIIITHEAEFYRVCIVKSGETFKTLFKILYVSPPYEFFKEQCKILSLATDSMSGNLNGLKTVESIKKLFDHNDRSGHIILVQKGNNKKDTKIYNDILEETNKHNNKQLYNISLCFGPIRKNKHYNVLYTSPLYVDCYKIWTFLQNYYSKLIGIYSKYSLLDECDIDNFKQICYEYQYGTLPKEFHTEYVGKIIKKKIHKSYYYDLE